VLKCSVWGEVMIKWSSSSSPPDSAANDGIKMQLRHSASTTSIRIQTCLPPSGRPYLPMLSRKLKTIPQSVHLPFYQGGKLTELQARELAWLLDSLQETLANLKSGLEECYALLAPIEPGSTLVISSPRSESIKGHITRVGTRIVKGVCLYFLLQPF
jgi:hypothetical protein